MILPCSLNSSPKWSRYDKQSELIAIELLLLLLLLLVVVVVVVVEVVVVVVVVVVLLAVLLSLLSWWWCCYVVVGGGVVISSSIISIICIIITVVVVVIIIVVVVDDVFIVNDGRCSWMRHETRSMHAAGFLQIPEPNNCLEWNYLSYYVDTPYNNMSLCVHHYCLLKRMYATLNFNNCSDNI